MPVYHVVGDALVSDAELIEKKTLGILDKFNAKETATLEYSTGLTTLDNMATTVPVLETAGEFADFVPIGLGKPLIIEIRNVYTGRETKKKKDLLVTSAIKNIASFNASPRAINFLKKNVSPHSNVTTPAATEQGTPLLFYSPALVQESSVFTVEFGFDDFPNEAFETVGGTFQKASGIPIFAVVKPYLIAAGIVTSLIGKLASKLFDKPAVFEASDRLSFDTAGMKPPQADYRLLLEEDADKSFLDKHKVNSEGVLVEVDSGSPYRGDIGYVVISLDGREKDSLKEFSPAAATAAVLKQFYKISEGDDAPLDPLIDALKLFNDLKFRTKADNIGKELEAEDLAGDIREKKTKERKALIDNILNDVLKPS